MDPYVVMKVGKNEFKTKVCEKGGKDPQWNENPIIIPTNIDD
jgi:hypothetical protein